MPDTTSSELHVLRSPFSFPTGQYQNPAPHADDGGSVGLDKDIQAAKIEPLEGQGGDTKTGESNTGTGLTDEDVDTARIQARLGRR